MLDLEQQTAIKNQEYKIGNILARARRNNIIKALSKAQGISEKKSVNTVFSNIIINASNNRIFLSSSNINIKLEDSIVADVKSQGMASVNTNMLYEICRKLPESSEVNIEQIENKLIIKSASSTFELPLSGQTASEETNTPQEEEDLKISISSELFRDLINKVYFATSVDEVRYYLCGVYIEISNDKLSLAATDGHRLACVESQIKQNTNKTQYAIIPKKTISELMKMLKDEESEVEISLTQNKIIFKWCVTKLTSDLIDGKFPPYKNVIPKIENQNNILTVKTIKIKETVDRVSSVSSDKTKAIKMKVEHGILTFSAKSEEYGSAIESIEAEYVGNVIEIGFNARYLMEAICNIEDENINIYIKDKTDPVMLIDKKRADITYVIMPMRV